MPATKTKKNGKNGKGTDAIYQMVTDRIIEALENGTVPWRKPWKVAGAHSNLISKRPYRGLNQFMLDMVAQDCGYSSPYWLTYKQIEAKGGKLKKINGEDEPGTGQKATPVIFWKIMQVDTGEVNDRGEKIIKRIPLLRYYNVFNVEQTEDIEYPVDERPEDFNPNAEAEAVIANMPNRPDLSWGGDRAFYAPALDAVRLPKPEDFDTPEHYYSTAFHELAHSTGHEKRLGRPEVMDLTGFGTDPYAKEELVAEMTAAMLSGWIGIDMPTQDNSAAYIASWLGRLKDDKKLVVAAASKAQQAADYILGDDDDNEGDD